MIWIIMIMSRLVRLHEHLTIHMQRDLHESDQLMSVGNISVACETFAYAKSTIYHMPHALYAYCATAFVYPSVNRSSDLTLIFLYRAHCTVFAFFERYQQQREKACARSVNEPHRCLCDWNENHDDKAMEKNNQRAKVRETQQNVNLRVIVWTFATMVHTRSVSAWFKIARTWNTIPPSIKHSHTHTCARS